ncbi:hypothetical protein [Kitasatospora sp. NPDC093806]|uniref:hypothetical protein n=1 Tax=Kitasatospora sp. NPDC093806 TaxID=3155075 RepID=UPI0034333808
MTRNCSVRGAAQPVGSADGVLKFGVEEEFLLVDPATRVTSPRAPGGAGRRPDAR